MNGEFENWSKQAQVARAGYANLELNTDLDLQERIARQIAALIDSGMSEAQAELFLGVEIINEDYVVSSDEGFEILADTFSEIPEPGRIFDSGFSATFVRDRSVNEITLAVRGTEFELFADLVSTIEDLVGADA